VGSMIRFNYESDNPIKFMIAIKLYSADQVSNFKRLHEENNYVGALTEL
jgi:hypothetical protein